MELLILYDNEILAKVPGLKKEWGFSCLIDTEEERILFDTGGDGNILLHNMDLLGVDPSGIDKIVISHEHWDHIGGLKELYHHIDGTEIFDLAFRDVPQGNTHTRVMNGFRISEGIHTTGLLLGEPLDEQSLVLEGKEGLWVLTGCSHPEVGPILQKARELGKIVGLIGGFHGLEDLSILKDLEHIYPMHCTVKKDEILKEYPDTSRKGGVGLRIEI